MVEIGLVYPHLAERPRRYMASANDGNFQRQDRVEESVSVLEQAQPGSASVSSPKLQGQNVMITTCASLTSESTLCVALSWTSDELESPVQIELDLKELEMGSLIAVKTFEGDSQSQLRLVMVDVQGKVLTLALNENLVPFSGFKVLDLHDYIEPPAVLQRVAGSELQSTMVTFLDSSTIIIAINPFILTVDLKEGTSHVWSELQCLEEMRSRASKLGNLFSNMSDMLLGREGESSDMAPTAAVYLAPNSLDGSHYCFTLHADAKLRKWKVDTNVSFMPMEVQILKPSDELPLPSRWSDARNAVCLSARLYGDVYALAVQIRTAGVIDISQPDSSDCHIFVLWGDLLAETSGASIKLRVPSEAMGLVGMDFVPTQKRCTLSVLLECSTEQGTASTMQLTYAPSNIAIISSEPDVEKNGNLDQIATKERNRIRCLAYGSIVADKMAMDNDQEILEEALHELDSMYMKYLFRPMFPRGTGTILAPSSACIRNALSKLVQGAAKHQEPGISIELETLKKMHHWRQIEHKRSLALGSSTSPRQAQRSVTPIDDIVAAAPNTLSVYESFVQQDLDDGEDETVMLVDDHFGTAEQLQQERSIEIEAHENRWRRFLLQVWEEEQVYRVPLTVSWLETIPLQVIIRAGVTSAIPERRELQQSSSHFSVLDNVASKLMKYVEDDEVYQAKVNHLEQQLVDLVAKGEIAVSPDSLASIRQGLQYVGAWAWSSDDDVISDEDHTALEEAASRMSSKQLISWVGSIKATRDGGFPGLGLVTAGDDNNCAGGFTWSQSRVANCQLRHSACYFSTVCLDSVRRLQLSRCLLLGDLIEGGHAREAALVAYVHSVSMLWAAAQRVPMPSTALQTKRRVRIQIGTDSPKSPPNKRLSFGDDSSSILAPASRSLTTAMDVMMIEISQTMDGAPSSFPSSHAGAALLLSRFYFKAVSSRKANGKTRSLPELGTLPKPRDDSVATDYPRLALRLLAPFVACTLPEDPVDVVLYRKESLAECLLIESHSDSLSGDSKGRMREMARLLLEPSSRDSLSQSDLQQIDSAFSALKSRETSQVLHSELVSCMGAIIQSGSQTEINRLCELDTVKRLFSSIASDHAATLDDDTKAAITCLAKSLLHLSRVIHKLRILERHVGASRTEADAGNSEIILSLIADATNQMEKAFPEHICQQMSEYSNFWSSLFHHSVSAGKWRQAYEACMKNPLIGRRESNFRRLVRSMVDCGALGELVELCGELGTSISALPGSKAKMESVDLYEIASEILADTQPSDLYMLRAQSTDPSQLSDYQGALYALHASQEQWRRAAQSMDIRYVNARKAMKSNASALGLRQQDAELRDHLIVEDLTLASVGAVNAMNLVRDPAHRFLVSGEHGRYTIVPIDGHKEPRKPKSIMKRSLRPEGAPMDEDEDEEDQSRLSRYMSLTELQGRSLRSIALRTMYFDLANTRSYAKEAFLRDLSSSTVDIVELFNTGYFRYGLLLSKAFASSRKSLTGSYRPNGQDLFYASIVDLLQSCLIPVSTRGVASEQRPSIQQLVSALDDSGDSDCYSSCIVANRNSTIAQLESASLRSAGWAFIRKLVLAFSTAETPVALDVANGMLSQQIEGAKLPSWLENLLLGSDIASPNGKFARRTNPKESAYPGNPQALLSLYTRQGMFVDACNLVTKILSDQSAAASRLPESGDIDYVPYSNIDFLWNLIDVMLESGGEIPASAEKEVLSARDEMEKSLEKHFSLLHISEMGLKSARALKGKSV